MGQYEGIHGYNAHSNNEIHNCLTAGNQIKLNQELCLIKHHIIKGVEGKGHEIHKQYRICPSVSFIFKLRKVILIKISTGVHENLSH
jgi:hypothetical protein